MENENTVQDIEILDSPDTILDSPIDNEIMEEGNGTEVLEEIEGESEELDMSDKTDTFSLEDIQLTQIDYTENLIAIDEHLQLASARIEYCNCLLIIILLIILLRYVYKFFKMFF